MDIVNERYLQDEKWGQQNHEPFAWLAILMEEVGEAAKAAAEAHWRDGDLSDYREELIQVAAVTVAMVECVDRARKKEVEK